MITNIHKQTNLNLDSTSYKSQTKLKQISNPGIEKTVVQDKEKVKDEPSVVYEPGDRQKTKASAGYTVDMEKVLAMKEETDARMIQLFRNTAKSTSLKQLGGIRGFLDKIENGDKINLDIEYTAADVQQAKKDVAEGGYWSASETSSRLVDFAKALSGSDPAKAQELKDAFVSGFRKVEEMFGGKGSLPALSYDTYDMTMKKFDEWIGGADKETEV